MRRDERGPFAHVARLPAEAIRLPVDAVVAAFHEDLRARRGHHREESVAIETLQRRERIAQSGERLGPAPAGAKGVEERHRGDDHNHGRDGGENPQRPFRGGRCVFVGGEAFAPAPRPRAVVDEQHAQRDREVVEERVISRGENSQLQRDERRRTAMPPAPRRDDEKGRAELDREHDRLHRAEQPVRELMHVPRGPERQRLRLEMKAQRAERAPCFIAARELHHAARQHQPEEQPPQKPAREPAHARLVRPVGPPLPRQVKHREQRRLEQQRVPLEIEKRTAHRAERKIERPQRQRARARRVARDQHRRDHTARDAHPDEESIARIEPAKRRHREPRRAAELLARGAQIFHRRTDALRAEQPANLHAERGKGAEKNRPEGKTESPAGNEEWETLDRQKNAAPYCLPVVFDRRSVSVGAPIFRGSKSVEYFTLP